MSMSGSNARVFASTLLLYACGGHQSPPPKLSGTEVIKDPLGPPVRALPANREDCGREQPCAAPPALARATTPSAAPSSTDAIANAPTLDPEQAMPSNSVTTNAILQVGQDANAMIDARSDVFSAGSSHANRLRGGVLPAAITLAPGGGSLVFSHVRGLIGCTHGSHYDADGGPCAGGHTRLTAAGVVSGITAEERSLFLTGVFLGGTPGPVPSGLDFSKSALGMAFENLAPQLGQSFFIGDGLTDTGKGSPQHFTIPAGATTLYLGFADGFGFRGAPDSYGDNTGSVAVQIAQQR
jgi:hypothetical protein